MFADNEYAVGRCVFSRRIIGYHANYLVIFINIYATHAGSCSTESSCVCLIEAAAASLASCEKDFAVTVCHHCLEEFISISNCDRDDTVCTRTRVRLKRSLLDDTLLGSEDNVIVVYILLILEVLHVKICLDLIVRLYVDHILDRTALRCT